MARTKRTQNVCKTCKYTWYPRGKSLSHKCPKCGSEDVGYAKGGLVLGALVIAGIVIFGGQKSPQPKEEPAVLEVQAQQPLAASEVAPAATDGVSPIATSGEPKESRGASNQQGKEEVQSNVEVPAEAKPTEPVANELY